MKNGGPDGPPYLSHRKILRNQVYIISIMIIFFLIQEGRVDLIDMGIFNGVNTNTLEIINQINEVQ